VRRANRFDNIRSGALCAASAVVLASWSAARTAAVAAPAREATASAVVARAAVLDLPEYIGVLDYMGERTRQDRRPGHSYSYRGAGLALDIDVFDYDPPMLLDGTGSPLVGRELARMEHAWLERGAKLVRTDTVTLGASGAAPPITAREAVFARRAAGFRGTSYLWITARGGRLYEMRFDVRAGFESDGQVSRSESLAALGRAIAHPTVPPSPPAADQIDVAIQWDPATPPAERRIWATYLYTRAALVAAESGQVSLALGEHTASFDEELRGRLMAVLQYRRMLREHPALHSAYFADLSRVQAAGYLREYVWRYLRAPSWPRPDGLKLEAFDAWRAVHLRGHVPQTHGRIDIVPLDRGAVAAQVASR
jgi:hypothetical protein